VFTPDESIAFIQNMWNTYRPTVWGPYGWKDGFNLGSSWVGTDVIGIDQGVGNGDAQRGCGGGEVDGRGGSAGTANGTSNWTVSVPLTMVAT